MTKKILLVIVAVIFMAALTACSQQPANPSAVAATVALNSQTSAAATLASPSITPSPSKSAPPASSVKATQKPSASSAPTSSRTSDMSIDQVINADEVNQKYASSLKIAGEEIKVTVENDTFTFFVTLDQDIKPADFTPDMQKQYKDDMNMQIQTILSEYPNTPDCIFAYSLTNHSGEALLQLTQYYTAE